MYSPLGFDPATAWRSKARSVRCMKRRTPSTKATGVLLQQLAELRGPHKNLGYSKSRLIRHGLVKTQPPSVITVTATSQAHPGLGPGLALGIFSCRWTAGHQPTPYSQARESLRGARRTLFRSTTPPPGRQGTKRPPIDTYLARWDVHAGWDAYHTYTCEGSGSGRRAAPLP